jgi:hypothetical protein
MAILPVPLEVVLKHQIRFKKTRARRQADRESAAYMGIRAFIGGLQRSHWALDGFCNHF